VYLFGALVFAAMSWLYFDALAVRPQWSVLLRGLGAVILALSYLVGAVVVEGIAGGWISQIGEWVSYGKILGYVVLGLGVWGEPLSERPTAGTEPARTVLAGTIGTWILPVLPAAVGLGYWRRASVGLERHLGGMAYGMYVLSLSEILDLRRLFTSSSDIRIYEMVRDFGSVWVVQLLVLATGLVMISRWVFSYLLRRFETQITLFMGMLVMSVFALATMVFTYVMASRLQLGAQREVASGASMTLNNWGREGDGLTGRARELVGVGVEDKEVLAKTLQSGERVLDSDGRDVLTGEKVEGLIEGVGYELRGQGSARQVVMVARQKRSEGWVEVAQEITGAQLSKSAQELSMAIRIYDQKTVIGSSSVLGYPEIASPLGLTEVHPGRLGGVAYTQALLPLKTSEGVTVAQVAAAIPLSTLWSSVGQALFWTYLAGVMVLIIMELPAVLMARYLTRQLRWDRACEMILAGCFSRRRE
jgi:hypothetical protein